MNIKRFILILFVIALFPVYACTNSGGGNNPPVFKQNTEMQMIKPQKSVKIKLKRNAKGEYSWEIRGDDADEILKTDKRLRLSIETH